MVAEGKYEDYSSENKKGVCQKGRGKIEGEGDRRVRRPGSTSAQRGGTLDKSDITISHMREKWEGKILGGGNR